MHCENGCKESKGYIDRLSCLVDMPSCTPHILVDPWRGLQWLQPATVANCLLNSTPNISIFNQDLHHAAMLIPRNDPPTRMCSKQLRKEGRLIGGEKKEFEANPICCICDCISCICCSCSICSKRWRISRRAPRGQLTCHGAHCQPSPPLMKSHTLG